MLTRLHQHLVMPLIAPIINLRAERLGAIISRHVQVGAMVLDVGCGDLRVGKALAERAGATVYGIDVVDRNRTRLPWRQFDGRHFPFSDDSFDVVLFSFVLHHTHDHHLLLSEARRVSRDGIILLEDTFDSSVGYAVTKWHDVIVNKLMYPAVHCPFTYRTLEGWHRAFDDGGLRVERVERIRSLPLNLQRQVLFRLSKRTNI
jgi:ubiquinone/menaquinone biosynthesis C-methylase UbiE